MVDLMVDSVPYKSKPTGAECGAIKNRASPVAFTLEELVSAIERGQTIIPALMTGTKAKDWHEQQLFMVDIDNSNDGKGVITPEQAVEACRDRGIMPLLYYYTFGHTEDKPKFRLAFLMREVIREECKRKVIMEGLIGLFEQADKSCRNADRLFFGTDKEVVLVDESARINLDDIYNLHNPAPIQPTSAADELTRLKQNFDLLGYMKQRNGECREIARGYMFKNCEICGHHDDLVYYADTNSFYCFGANGNQGGSIIDYIMLSEKVDVKAAVGKLYKLSNMPYSGEHEWQRPIPFDDFTLPAFPVETIPAPFGAFIEAVAEDTQTAVDMAAMHVLGVVATAVQKKLRIEGKPGHIEPLNIYALIIAKPAERKSAVNQATTAVLDRYEKQVNEKLGPQINEQNVRLAILQRDAENAIKKGDGEKALSKKLEIFEIEENRKHAFRLIASDATPEALTSLLHENGGKMAIISAEGGIFTTLAGQYSKNVTNIDTVLKAHAGDTIRVDRINRESEFIYNPCLSMVICLQDSVIGEIFANEQFKGRGLVARMLFCKPQSTVGRRAFDTTPIAPETRHAYEDAVFALLEYPDAEELLHLTDEALAVSKEWFQQLEPMHVEELADMGDWSGKLHGATLRIAGLLHCMEHWNDLGHNPIVSGKTMENAIQIGTYLLEHAKWAYLAMGADLRATEAKYVLKKIKALGKPVLPLRDIMRKCRKGSLGSVEKITPALALLEEYGYIRSFEQRPTQGKGKPNVFYEVNPCVTRVTAETDPIT